MLSCSLLLISLLSHAQWTYVGQQDLAQNITTADVSTLGQVYYGTERGNIYSLQADGTRGKYFSSSIFQPVTYISASNPLRIFVFYQDAGAFEFLDRFTAFPRTYYFNDFGISNPEVVAYDNTHTIWTLLGNNLLQINPFNYSVLTDQNWTEVTNTSNKTRMISHEGLFLADAEQGIFNRQGLIEALSQKGIYFFQIIDDKIMALSEAGLTFWNRYSGRTETLTPPRKTFKFAVKCGSYFHFVEGSNVFIYKREE